MCERRWAPSLRSGSSSLRMICSGDVPPDPKPKEDFVNQSVLDRMRNRATQVRARVDQQQYTRTYNLTGKNAIVQPGGSVIMRLLPRWDIKGKWMKDQTGKVVVNPKYQEDFIY